MGDAAKKRPWFQFHLSTAVLLMLVASGILWANMQPAVQVSPTMGLVVLDASFVPDLHQYWYGWPFRCRWVSVHVYGPRPTEDRADSRVFYDMNVDVESRRPGAVVEASPDGSVAIRSSSGWRTKDVLGDAGVALTILVSAAILLEWRIRRKERRE